MQLTRGARDGDARRDTAPVRGLRRRYDGGPRKLGTSVTCQQDEHVELTGRRDVSDIDNSVLRTVGVDGEHEGIMIRLRFEFEFLAVVFLFFKFEESSRNSVVFYRLTRVFHEG